MKKLSLVLLTLVSSIVFGNQSAFAQMKITPLLKSEAEKVEEDDVPVVVEDEKILTVSEMFADEGLSKRGSSHLGVCYTHY